MKKIISAILAILMMLSICPAVFAATVDSGIEYVDSTKSFDTAPGRGLGRYYWIVASADGTTASYTAHPTGLSTPMYDLRAFSSGNDYTQSGYTAAADKPELVGGTNVDINVQTLVAIRRTFDTARAKGVLCIPRFSYACLDYVGTEPDDVNWIIRHIEQLCEILNEYKDIIIGVEGGMIGPWGEMHSSKYTDKQYANQVVGAWLENLDESIPLMVRNPNLFLNYAGKNATELLKELPLGEDHPLYRIGMYNDGYLGTDLDYGTWYTGMNREGGVQFLSGQALRSPYGGELAYTNVPFLTQNKSPIYTDGFVKELYDTHLCYLRNLDANREGLQSELSRLTLSENYLFEGMPDVTPYHGLSLKKFINDHMGYRFVLREAKISDSVEMGGELSLIGKVENTGFGNLLGKMKAEVLLVDGQGGKTYIPVTLDPAAWQTNSVSDYALSVALPASLELGEYTAYLRFSAISGVSAAADTRAVPFANPLVYDSYMGANRMGTFTLRNAKGDVNTDGVINVIDMTLIARYIAQGGVSGGYDLSACDLDLADMNGDGAVDQLDLNAVGAVTREQ